MLYAVFALTSSLVPIIASAVPQQTAFANSTKTYSPGATTDCPVQCSRLIEGMNSLTWSPVHISTTIIVETLLYVVNEGTNSTRTTTVSNTEVDLTSYTATLETNSAGTRTTSFVVTANNTTETHTLTFPTIFYTDYSSSYTLCGTLPTTVSGATTCLKHPCVTGRPSLYDSGAPVFAFPSHPPLQETVQTIGVNIAQDPEGLSWEAVWVSDDNDPYLTELQPLFPDLGYWNCTLDGTIESPETAKSAALFLTATSTSTEPNRDLPTSTQHQATPPLATKPSVTVNEAATALAKTSASSSPALGLPNSSVAPSPTLLETPESQAPTSNSPLLGLPTPSVTTSPTVLKTPYPQGPASNPPLQGLPTPDLAPSSVSVLPGKTTSPSSVGIIDSSTADGGSILVPVSQSPALFLTLTNAQGSQSTVPAIILTSSDAQGSQIVSTSPLTAEVSTNPQGSQIIVASPATAAVFTSINSEGSQTIVASPVQKSAAPFFLNGQTFSTNAKSEFLISAQPLPPELPAILGSGTATTTPVVLQISSSGTIILPIVGPSTSTLLPTTPTSPPPAFTIASQTVTANSQNQYIVGGQALTPPGGVITASGTTISLAPGAAQVFVGTSTEELGGYITGGLGGGGGGAVNGTGNGQPFLGAAEGRRRGMWRSKSLVVAVIIALAVCLLYSGDLAF